jgi:hypothetical protein
MTLSDKPDNESRMTSPEQPHGQKTQRKPYVRPQLYTFGDLRGLTLGGSPGVGDSGNPRTQRSR